MNLAEKISEISQISDGERNGSTFLVVCLAAQWQGRVRLSKLLPGEYPQPRLEMIFPRLSAVMNEENIKIMAETLTL